MTDKLASVQKALEKICGIPQCASNIPEYTNHQAQQALSDLKEYTERLESVEFEEELGVAIAEAYVMIPKGTCWEDATENLTQAAINIIRGRHGK